MSLASIITEAEVSNLVAAGPQKFGTNDALEFIERASGLFDPAPPLLRDTINAVFWASLSEEEGKPVLPRVLFADIRDPDCRLQPRQVCPDAISKLSPLLDVSGNALLINRDAKIVGVGRWQNRDVGIVAHRPGRLAVLDGSLVLGVLDKGSWVIVGGSSINISAILQRALPDQDPRDRLLKATLIVRIAMKARRAGRGATLVLLPDAQRNGICDESYAVEGFTALQEALQAWLRASRATPSIWERDQNRGLVSSAMAIAAAGAGIDGATLIDSTNLRLLAFGTKINADDGHFDVRRIELPSSDVQVVKKGEIGGMRHQSAARLVRQNPNAKVITVSQDGPVSLFVWDQGEASVMMFKHLDRYLEAEAGFDQ
jgi:hypothetical protein